MSLNELKNAIAGIEQFVDLSDAVRREVPLCGLLEQQMTIVRRACPDWSSVREAVALWISCGLDRLERVAEALEYEKNPEQQTAWELALLLSGHPEHHPLMSGGVGLQSLFEQLRLEAIRGYCGQLCQRVNRLLCRLQEQTVSDVFRSQCSEMLLWLQPYLEMPPNTWTHGAQH